jgi:hypothetical protein
MESFCVAKKESFATAASQVISLPGIKPNFTASFPVAYKFNITL